MSVQNDEAPNGFQTFSTILALLLPVVQFFFNFLPSQSQSIFLIQPYFLVVSIIAGIFAYLLIIAFKNTVWFSVALNRKKNREYKSYLRLIDRNVYTEDEIKANVKKHYKEAPFSIMPANIYYVLIPVIFVLVLGFLAIGLFYHGSTNPALIFIQAIFYIMLVTLTSLTLGAFYINDSNNRRREAVNKDKYRRVQQLLFENRALGEFPVIEFVGQGSLEMGTLSTIIRVNGQKVYLIKTDPDAGILQTVEQLPDAAPTQGENNA